MYKRLFPLGMMAMLAVSAYSAEPAVTELVEDQYIYHNAPLNGHTRVIGSIFTAAESEWGGIVRMKFKSNLPAGVTPGSNYVVTSAKLEVWVDEAGATQITWNPTDVKINAYAAGYETGGVTEADWFQTKDRYDNWNAEYQKTSPFGRDFVTDSPVLGQGNAWAVAEHPDYPYATAPTEKTPFKATFNFDVSNAKIQQELKADLESGFSSWVLGTNFISQIAGTYPKIALKGVTLNEANEYETTLPAAPAQIPTLTIEVEPEASASVSDWNLFN